MKQSPATGARILRSSIEPRQAGARICRLFCGTLLVAAVMASPLGRSPSFPDTAGVDPVQRTGLGLSLQGFGAGLPVTAGCPGFLVPALEAASPFTEPLLTRTSSSNSRKARYGPALVMVLGLLSLAALSILILSLRREWAWKHVRSETGEQITRDLALLDDTIRAEMKRYESLSRLEGGA